MSFLWFYYSGNTEFPLQFLCELRSSSYNIYSSHASLQLKDPRSEVFVLTILIFTLWFTQVILFCWYSQFNLSYRTAYLTNKWRKRSWSHNTQLWEINLLSTEPHQCLAADVVRGIWTCIPMRGTCRTFNNVCVSPLSIPMMPNLFSRSVCHYSLLEINMQNGPQRSWKLNNGDGAGCTQG